MNHTKPSDYQSNQEQFQARHARARQRRCARVVEFTHISDIVLSLPQYEVGVNAFLSTLRFFMSLGTQTKPHKYVMTICSYITCDRRQVVDRKNDNRTRLGRSLRISEPRSRVAQISQRNRKRKDEDQDEEEKKKKKQRSGTSMPKAKVKKQASGACTCQ